MSVSKQELTVSVQSNGHAFIQALSHYMCYVFIIYVVVVNAPEIDVITDASVYFYDIWLKCQFVL